MKKTYSIRNNFNCHVCKYQDFMFKSEYTNVSENFTEKIFKEQDNILTIHSV